MGWAQDAEARMTAEAKKAMLESGDWLTTAEITRLAGASARHSGAQPQMEKKRPDLRHPAFEYRLFSEICLGPRGRLPSIQVNGAGFENLSREKGRLEPRVLVRIDQQLPGRKAPARYLGYAARTSSRSGGG